MFNLFARILAREMRAVAASGSCSSILSVMGKGGVSVFKLTAQTLAREMRAVAASAVSRAGGEIAKSLVTLVNSVLAAAAAFVG